jgi:hypothetical protein
MENSIFFKRNPDLLEFFDLIKSELQQKQRPPEETILDDVDLREMLKASPRTTAEWRAKKLITYSKIQGKIYYRLSDVLDFLDRNSVQDNSKRLRIRL